MRKDNILIDTNIWLYSLIKHDTTKHDKIINFFRQKLRRSHIIITHQIINEVSYNLLRKGKFSERDVSFVIQKLYKDFIVVDAGINIFLTASKLRKKYKLSFWDSQIVASGLLNNCQILYSEDMHHGQVIEDQLKIINPLK